MSWRALSESLGVQLYYGLDDATADDTDPCLSYGPAATANTHLAYVRNTGGTDVTAYTDDTVAASPGKSFNTPTAGQEEHAAGVVTPAHAPVMSPVADWTFYAVCEVLSNDLREGLASRYVDTNNWWNVECRNGTDGWQFDLNIAGSRTTGQTSVAAPLGLHFIVYTIDDKGTHAAYDNGELLSLAGGGGPTTGTTNEFQIARRMHDLGAEWTGPIYEVGFANQGWSASDVANLYQRLLPRPPVDSLRSRPNLSGLRSRPKLSAVGRV